uniref:Uncharacterized protein n=1 Tax=Lactuca sativa TaxID=4236 RepID=A0A9R1VD14_LACSA|nr:hypothetical protein LSAT_V11C500290360 [Lactuca sativa]
MSQFPVHALFTNGDEIPIELIPHMSARNPIPPTQIVDYNTTSKISEITVTVDIGAMIGFEIDVDNQVLAEILGESSEIKGGIGEGYKVSWVRRLKSTHKQFRKPNYLMLRTLLFWHVGVQMILVRTESTHWGDLVNGIRVPMIFANVYGPKSTSDKATLQKELIDIKKNLSMLFGL